MMGVHLKVREEAEKKKTETIASGVNFINLLRTTFALVDPKSVKIHLSHQYLFTLLGSTSVTAVHRMFMKSTPGEEYIQLTDEMITSSVMQVHLNSGVNFTKQ